jgi:hypothetical protein
MDESYNLVSTLVTASVFILSTLRLLLGILIEISLYSSSEKGVWVCD